MAKQLKFTYKAIDYTLEFSRKVIEDMERAGFIADDITTKPATTLPALFAGAFRMHHKHKKRELIDEIYSHMTKKDELIGKLAEMYNEALEVLLLEPEDGDEGNVEWTMV